MKTFLALLVTVFLSLPGYTEDHSHLPEGGRSSLHGMVLYGSRGEYFLDHIPMERAPHDFQIVARVLLRREGKPLSQNFTGTFTLKPGSRFSLNDYLAGRLKHFSGEIYAGGFEQDGKVIPGLEKIDVEVISLSLVRQLPGATSEEDREFSAGGESYRVNIITPARNFQSVTLKSSGRRIWCVKGPDFFEPCE